MKVLKPSYQWQSNNSPGKKKGSVNINESAVHNSNIPKKKSDLMTPLKEAHQDAPGMQRVASFKQIINASLDKAAASVGFSQRRAFSNFSFEQQRNGDT